MNRVSFIMLQAWQLDQEMSIMSPIKKFQALNLNKKYD